MTLGSIPRIILLALFALLQFPAILLPLFIGHFFFHPGHSVNLVLRGMVAPLATSPYLLFLSTRVSVQFSDNLAPPQPKVSRFLLMTHSSTLDFMVVTFAAWMLRHLIGPAVCIIKKELLSLPLFGWLQIVAGSVPVSRSGDLAAAKDNLAVAHNRSREGYTIAGFPEGSRRRTPSFGPEHLLPFKKGMFHMAKDIAQSTGNEVHFIPLVMVGGNTAWPANCLLPIAASEIVIRVGDPVKMKPDENVEELKDRIRTCMQTEINRTGALQENKTYSIHKAFQSGFELNLWKEIGFEAFLTLVPSIVTLLLAIFGQL